MKNLIFIFSLIVFTVSTAKAQESVYFGVKGGVNFSNMSSEYFSDSKVRTGFHLGVLAEVPLTDRFSIQPEVLYSTQGSEVEEILLGGGPRTTEYFFDYIQVPVLAKLYLIQSLSIEAGPSFNFLVQEEVNGEESEFGRSFEFGGALGATYKIRGGFFGSARYTYGFTDSFKAEFNDNVINSGFQLGIGMIF